MESFFSFSGMAHGVVLSLSSGLRWWTAKRYNQGEVQAELGRIRDCKEFDFMIRGSVFHISKGWNGSFSVLVARRRDNVNSVYRNVSKL